MDINKLKKIYADDPEMLHVLELKQQTELLKEIASKEASTEVSFKGVKELKGDDGYTPIKDVDYFDGQDGKPGERGEKGDKGEDGKDGRNGFDGTDGKDGEDGQKGDKGDKGEDGENASIADVIKELKKKQYLEPKDIKGLPINMADMRWHGGGLSTVSHDTTLTGDGTPSNPLSVNESADLVTSVSNADGTLTITPTLGNVVASRSAITGDISIPAGSNVSAYNGIVPISKGGTGSGTALTQNSVVFVGPGGLFTEDNSNFIWDNTNKREGISTASLLINGVTPTSQTAISLATTYYPLTVGVNNTNFVNTVGGFGGTANAFLQVGHQNTSSGTLASTDFVAQNDTSSNGTNYVDMGITSSTFADPNFTLWGGATAGYVFTESNRLTLATARASAPIVFGTGGTLSANERMRIDGTGNVAIGTATASTRLTISAAGSNGINLAQDTGTSTNSARLYFSNATGAQTWAAYNLGGVLTLGVGGTVGTSSGTTQWQVSTAGNTTQLGSITAGLASATTAQLTVTGGASGTAIITLKRTSGATATYSWALAGAGLTFSDDVAGFIVGDFQGDNNLNELYLGQKNRGASTTRDSVLAATTLQASAGTDIAGVNLRIQSGLGTGAGVTGDINFYTANLLASGTTQQTQSIRVTIKGNTGNVGIGNTSPTAILQLKAGTATASTAPLKFTSGTNLTVAEAGAVEWDGTRQYNTQTTGPTRQTVAYLSDLTTSSPGILSTTTAINGKTVANTSLYTVPTGKTAIVTGYYVIVTAATAITIGPSAGIGNASGTNNIVASQAMTALLTTADTFNWPITGMSKTVTTGNSVFFNLGVAATGTSETLTVYLTGFLI